MATSDHTARACPSIPIGDAHSASPPASYSTPPTLRLSTSDDVALALYTLAQLSRKDDRQRHPERRPDAMVLLPLPPLFRQGIAVARQCLLQYARQLDYEQALKA